MLMPGERVTVYGRPGGKNSLLVSSAQRGRAFLGTETSRSTVSPGPLDEKVSGATLVDCAAWAASTTFSSAGRRSGYDKQEVDAFRSAVRDTFLGGAVFWVSTPPVRSDDLRGKQFSTHRPGYDKTQVNAFLEAAGIRLAAMESTDRPAGPLVSSAILAGWAEWADSTTFSYGGYAADEVDAFRRAIRDTFRGLREPPVTSGDVHGKQFPSTDNVPGYDKAQVDAFLEAAGLRLAAMESTDRPVGPLVSSAILAGWAEWADSTTFSRNGWRSGYTATVVDAFLRAFRDTFRAINEPPVRSDDVHGKQFPSTDNPGYDKTQVDAFLEAAGIRLAAMESTDRPEEPFVSSAVLAEWARWADSTRFSTTRRPTGGGYDTTEVDAFRDEVRDTFIRKRHPLLTSEEAHGKKFTLRLLRRGYKVEQVDAFFDEAEVKLAAMRRSDQGGHD